MSNPPTAIGKYQIIREIARSNDIVYEAYDPLMDRRVALKELNVPGGSTDQQRQDRIARFERECRAAGRLAHPNIMTVYEFGQDSDRVFMAMEYLDGNTLRNEIDTKGKLAQDRAIEIAKAILAGLEHAHSNGVVHRDIKPDNIQLTSSGVKITDFGIARLTFQPNLTIDGQVFGTPSYMSPEQVRGGDIDARSDIFSVGVVLYEMLTGSKPFTGDSVITITYSILNKEPDAPQSVGFGLWRVLERAMDKSPQMRWTSAKEMSASLDEALAQQEAGVIPMGTTTIMPGFTPPPAGNPYMTPYNYPPATGSTMPPPVITPYQTGSYGAAPPPQQGYTMPTQIPVYYPPPPRRPMMTPEQAAGMRRVGTIVFVLGSFFATVIMAILYFTESLGSQVHQTGRPKPAPPVNGVLPDLTGVTPSGGPAADPAGDARLLVSAAEGDLTRAQMSTNRRETEQALLSAAKNFENAATIEPDSEKKQSDNLQAAEAYYQVFLMRRQAGVTGGDLREPLYGAVRTAPDGTEIALEAKSALQDLS